MSEIEKAGYLTPETVFIDGTHIKANANMKKAIKKAVPKAAKIYEEQLMKEVNEDREKNGKKPFDDNDKNKGSKAEEEKTVLESTTNLEKRSFPQRRAQEVFCVRSTNRL